jgi:hypothetical protein
MTTSDIQTDEGTLDVYAVTDGIEIYTVAASTDASVDLVLTREQAATLIARLAAVLAEA